MVVAMVIRLGRARLAALFVILLLPSVLLVQQRYFDPRDYYADQGVTGPFEAIPDGLATDGRPRFTAGEKLDFVRPGQRFAWVSTVCLDAGGSMLARADLVRLRDDTTVVTGRQVLITPEWSRCGPATGSAVVPPDAEDGDHEERRVAVVRPLSWWPLLAPLKPLRVPVRRD